ncbi:hypothetical protein EBZ39_04905 [bacterium]|nr:hypothetical protein [bacterium]
MFFYTNKILSITVYVLFQVFVFAALAAGVVCAGFAAVGLLYGAFDPFGMAGITHRFTLAMMGFGLVFATLALGEMFLRRVARISETVETVADIWQQMPCGRMRYVR